MAATVRTLGRALRRDCATHFVRGPPGPIDEHRPLDGRHAHARRMEARERSVRRIRRVAASLRGRALATIA